MLGRADIVFLNFVFWTFCLIIKVACGCSDSNPGCLREDVQQIKGWEWKAGRRWKEEIGERSHEGATNTCKYKFKKRYSLDNWEEEAVNFWLAWKCLKFMHVSWDFEVGDSLLRGDLRMKNPSWLSDYHWVPHLLVDGIPESSFPM